MNASTSKLLSTALIEDELSKAKAGLAQHCQHQQQPPHSKSHPSNEIDNFPTAELKLFRRAKELQHQVESLDLIRSVAKFVSDIVIDKTRNLESGGDTLAVPTLLLNATETCTALGLLLLQHNQKYPHNNPELQEAEGQQQYLYTALLKWYESIYNSTKTIAVQIFHQQLRQHAPEYPSNQLSSVIISGALSVTTSSSSCYYEWNLASKCLVEVQVVYDALQFSTQKQESSLSSSSPSWRLHILDELCQPLADRVRFHFLEEQSGGIMSSSATTTMNEGGDSHAVRSSKVDRLPEWLFRYLREVVENQEVHTLVMLESLQPLIDSVINSIIIRAEEGFGGVYDDDENDEVLFNVNDEGKSTVGAQRKSLLGADEIFLQLKSQKYNHVSTYFLREVTRMARHVLRAKSFFHHPDVVGSECRDRSIVLRGIEQLFLFDSFVCDKIKDGGVQGGEYDEYGAHEYHQMGNVIFIPPRLVDTFLLMDESLYKWWMEEERVGMIALLRDCAASTLLHLFRSQNEEGEVTVGMDTSLRTAERQYPPISELFVALLHAARRKCETISDERCCQMYVADVVSPFCSEYMDLVHDEASWLRIRLLRPPTASSTPGSSVKLLRTANLPSDSLLTWNTLEWSSLITGTHLAAQAILLRQSPSKFDNHPNDILELVGDSMNLLCTAMVDEFISAFVETIVMERGKLASYMMRAPFLLSHHSPDDNDSPERRSKRDKDASLSNVHFALSPDLNDSIHVLSIGVKACNKVMGKSMPSLETNQLSSHLNHGVKSIHDALKFSIGQKLLDIAIDPQGMTPEIYISGAIQFQHDVDTFDRLFRAGGGNGAGGDAEQGPLERAVSASRLMSLELSQIEGIRSALRDLAVRSSAGVGSYFGHRRGDEDENQFAKRLNVDDFYGDERLMNEAVSMLEAKDFGALSLDEALLILNRRM